MTEYLISGDKEKCCGCSACVQACPVSAITFAPDDEGFLYPEINKSLCVKCGRCKQVCPYDSAVCGNAPLKTYAMINQNSEELLNSSSGGAFIALANRIIKDGGFVCGCIFNEELKAIHILSSNSAAVKKMQGSKYVQSDLGGVYAEIKDKLENGKAVLFSGTPCQVDGLKKYLGKEYALLYTADLICHGVPSPRLLADFIESEKVGGKNITDIKFRDKKRNGWRSCGAVEFSDGNKKRKKTISPFNNSYYQLYYLLNNVSRPCCYSCRYSNTNRVGDVTIGDYWNIADILPKIDTSGGVSAVLVNTEKGDRLIEKIRDGAILAETPLKAAVAGNGNLSAPCQKPDSRDDIYKRIAENGYAAVAEKECHYKRVMPFIRRHMPKGLKTALKKILK